MIICHSRKFVFVHLHKCAGTSITAALTPLMQPGDLIIDDPPPVVSLAVDDPKALHKHSTAAEIASVLGQEIWKEYFTFAIVRHPLDRLVSFYEFLNRVRRNNPLPRKGLMRRWLLLLGIARKERSPDQPPWDWPGMQSLMTTNDFSGFIRSEHLAREQAVNSQSRSLFGSRGELLVDFVGRFENLNTDWSHVCYRIGTDVPLGISNISPRRHDRWRDYCSNDDVAFLTEVHRIDFEQFCYERPGT